MPTRLRVDFVDRCLPDARYLFITRDGIDAAVSAAERWNSPLDVRYTAKKVRFVPPSDLPYYGARFLAQRLKRIGKGDNPKRVTGWWGPRLDGQKQLQESHDLIEICALCSGNAVSQPRPSRSSGSGQTAYTE